MEKQIMEWYAIFRKYPEVFPAAYFRFLKANLAESQRKNTFIYNNNVLLTWKQYQKTTKIGQAGDFLLEKMVSKNPGDGQAQAVMDVFLRSLPKGGTCFLKVAASNKRAICFYTRNGFKKVSAVNFGSIPGFIMKLNKF